MKKIIIVILLLSSTAYAQHRAVKFHSTPFVATGYADVALSGPANLILNNKPNGFVGLSIDVRGTLSEGLSAKAWVKDVIEFEDSLKSIIDLAAQFDKLMLLADRANWNLRADVQIELLSFYFTGKFGSISVGSYINSTVGIISNMPRDIKLTINHIDIGSRTNVLLGKGYGDGGIKFSYAKIIDINSYSLGVGIQHRIFHRFFVPLHTLTFEEHIRYSNDITIPEFRYNRGWGFGTDLFLAFQTNDPYVDGRIGFEISNVYANIWYDNYSQRDMILMGFGGSISPLRYFNIKDFKVLMDIEIFEDGKPSVHMGSLWKFGNDRFYFTPSIGLVMVGRDLWGNAYHSFTAGFSTKIAILEIGGAFEYTSNNQYDIGTKIGIGW